MLILYVVIRNSGLLLVSPLHFFFSLKKNLILEKVKVNDKGTIDKLDLDLKLLSYYYLVTFLLYTHTPFTLLLTYFLHLVLMSINDSSVHIENQSLCPAQTTEHHILLSFARVQMNNNQCSSAHVVGGLKTQLHLRLCIIRSQCVPDHHWMWFGRLDHTFLRWQCLWSPGLYQLRDIFVSLANKLFTMFTS